MTTDALVGRTFGPRLFDYLLIGGALSLVVTVIVLLNPLGAGFVNAAALPYLFLLGNVAHFAASTVRLYTKPGSYESLPFLTMAFPLVALIVLTVSIVFAGQIGPHLQSLYLTWSPYHYAAQAYGLAVMYSYRSGCSLGATDKKLLWWVAMLPFFYNFLTAPGVGLRWLLPDSVVATPLVAGTLVVAAINLHHFIVDGYIWRLKKGDSNYRVVESGVPA